MLTAKAQQSKAQRSAARRTTLGWETEVASAASRSMRAAASPPALCSIILTATTAPIQWAAGSSNRSNIEVARDFSGRACAITAKACPSAKEAPTHP